MASTTSSIARSLTTRMNRKGSDSDGHGLMSRAFSTKRPQDKAPHRPEISLPLELLSATNPLAFTAPDITPRMVAAGNIPKLPLSPAQTLASTASSTSLRSDNSSAPGLSTSSSVASPSPITTPVNEMADIDFNKTDKRVTGLPDLGFGASIESMLEGSSTTKDAQSADDKTGLEAPVIPKRAPSHTKKTHQALHRQRSLSRIGARSPSAGARGVATRTEETDSRKSSSSGGSGSHLSAASLEKDEDGVKVVRNSIDIFSTGTHSDNAVSKDHPFGAELAKLDEMAEEFSPTKSTHDEESKRGLRRERSFKSLRRGLSRKGKKDESEAKPEAESSNEAPATGLQRQRSFKVLRRDPSTKELKAADDTGAPKLEKAEEAAQEQLSTVAIPSSRRRAGTIKKEEQPTTTMPTTPSKSRTVRQQRLNKLALAPTEPTIWDEESEYLNKHGLKMWSAEDYMSEIGSPYQSTFNSSNPWL